MLCPKCSASVADDSNFCRRCGTPFKKRNGFVANLWRDNKPGFLILSLLLVAMIGSFGYYLSSRSGRFIVTVERITRDEALDLYSNATLKVYCREFQADCKQRGEKQVLTDIRAALPGVLRSPTNVDAKIVYSNETGSAIAIQRFLYRTKSSESWKAESPQNIFKPKLDRLRSAIETARADVPFEVKLDFASTLAVTENHGAITVLPGEVRIWRLGLSPDSEFRLEYRQNGKLFETPVLKPR
jgi:hypothetical protein